MVDKKVIKMISHWFQIARGCSLLLPDGWFGGRPHEGQHTLTYLEVRPHKLLMELDEQLLLIFTEIATVRIENSDLVLTDFQQFVFDWQGYGDLLPHVAVYRQGTVKLVPPIGTTIKDTI